MIYALLFTKKPRTAQHKGSVASVNTISTYVVVIFPVCCPVTLLEHWIEGFDLFLRWTGTANPRLFGPLLSARSSLHCVLIFCSPYSFSVFCSLSQFSEENMMDPYNLAICFGPTLMSVPEGHDQVSCQAHVNELIKTIIIQHENVFPGTRELEGPVYTRSGSTEDYWYGRR